MKLLNVYKDHRYLYIHTDEGTRKQSLSWNGVAQLERKCLSLVGQEIRHSTSGSWDKDVWFQDVTSVSPAPTLATTDTTKPNFPPSASQFPLNRSWSNRSVKRIFGPPGTGKTSKLVEMATAAIAGGIRPEDVGYFAFTNVAADEARDRIAKGLELEPNRFANFSTLHSLTTRMGGNEGKHLCQQEHFKSFDPSIGTREEWLRAGDASSVVVRPEHPVLSEYSIMFNRKEQAPSFSAKSLETAQHCLSRYYGQLLGAAEVPEYADKYFRAYQAFKQVNNLADFNDVVLAVASDAFPAEKIPSFELLIVDEAQDLSALQWDVVAKLAGKAHATIIAGDDDQAIMEAFGAAPHLFNAFPTTEPDEILPVSHRLPKNIKNFVDKFIVPKLTQRVGRKDKQWSEDITAVNAGEVIQSVQLATKDSSGMPIRESLSLNRLLRVVEASKGEEWLIMAPTRASCDKVSAGLAALQVPHFCHRKDVLGINSKIQVQTIHTSKGMGMDNTALVSLTRGDGYLLDHDSRLLYVALTRSKTRLFIVAR